MEITKMYTILRYESGRRVEGLMLSASPNLVRLVLRNQVDTAEFQRVYGVWTGEDGSAVEFESMVAGDHTDMCQYRGSKTLTAN